MYIKKNHLILIFVLFYFSSNITNSLSSDTLHIIFLYVISFDIDFLYDSISRDGPDCPYM